MKHLLTLVIALSILSCKKDNGYNTNQSSSGDSDGDNKFIYTTTTVSWGDDSSTKLSPEAKLGQEIFDGKGNCFSCHRPDQKVVGPSIQEIAKIYKSKNGDIVTFLKGKGEPIVDPSQYEVMKTNFYLTKTFSDKELKAVEAYIYSFQ
jgi:cytochrome c